ncbi:hypothetical protein [Desulfonatronum sp. SC1]|uniref:hypothetical protein n=1 Tax=Desulfonatronum sp. SC1 TaxID=2109626 RepID=UPI000D3274AB|nr:hypothetical protein [Desulfonatronum sp. SC1]PTN37876.1 hypothetical protein C6366_04940 [Desulfonatronum sp. SC1]
MALFDLWKNSPDQLRDKQIHQLIAFSGAGKLRDGSPCSDELRAFLSMVPSSALAAYADQCLSDTFTDSGLALQDVVNEIGSRLGAEVIPGRYRGKAKEIGFDGLWIFPNGQSIVVEVKTTDAYRIDLNVVAGYQRELVDAGRIEDDASSILLVVGRQDTGDLEAQIRGSRFAWDIRIISVDALNRLVATKEEVEDPVIIDRIHSILIPREFTRLDEIANILFSAAEDIKQEASPAEDAEQEIDAEQSKEPKFKPVAFHEACAARLEKYLGESLIKRSRASYHSVDKSIRVNCAVSKEHDPEKNPNYWYAFHPHQRDYLSEGVNSFVVFGCGSSKRVLVIPFNDFIKWLDGTWTTEKEDRYYWHVVIDRNGDKYSLRRRKGLDCIDLTMYLLPAEV